MEKLSLIVPCFNEADFIDPFLARLEALTQEIPLPFEVVFIDNASTDESPKKLSAQLRTKDPARWRLILLNESVGYGYNVVAALRHSSGDVFCLVRLFCDPRNILRALEIARKQSPTSSYLIKGVPRRRAALGRLRDIGLCGMGLLFLRAPLWNVFVPLLCFNRAFFETVRLGSFVMDRAWGIGTHYLAFKTKSALLRFKLAEHTALSLPHRSPWTKDGPRLVKIYHSLLRLRKAL